MSTPNNPFEIVIRNRFFPEGLTEQDIYNYWIRNKFNILKNLNRSKSIIYIAPSENQQIIRRYVTQGVPFKLTEQNYDRLITGRTIGILQVFDNSSDEGIIDIDSPKEEDKISSDSNFEAVKKVTYTCYQYFSKRFPTKLIFTGKNGFHLRCQMPRKLMMENIKQVLLKSIKDSPLEGLLVQRNSESPNLDLSPNMKNGGVIVPGSLNIIGLPCVELDIEDLNGFKRENLIQVTLDNIKPINESVFYRSPYGKIYTPQTPPIYKRQQTRPFPSESTQNPGIYRNNMRVGSIVLVAEKINYHNGLLTRGRVVKILTPKLKHTRGIKVLLDNGKIGRVQQILVY